MQLEDFLTSVNFVARDEGKGVQRHESKICHPC